MRKHFEIYTLISQKLFRKRENWNKIQFILDHSNISIELIATAAVVAKRNPYHNFGHALGVAEYVIKIALIMGLPLKEINIMGVTALFHDAGHQGIMHWNDEMYSLELMNMVMSDDDFAIFELSREQALLVMRDVGIATIFPNNRGKINDLRAKIIQDSDLANIGQDPVYLLWSSMGLIDEFNKVRTAPLTPFEFIYSEQEKFVNFLKILSSDKNVYLSDGAKKIFAKPEETVIELKKVSPAAINFAFEVRREDITLKEFGLKIKQLNG